MTLRTFHVGGIASVSKAESELVSKFDGKVEFDGIRTTKSLDEEGNSILVVLSRAGEMRIMDPKSAKVYSSLHIPYGSTFFIKDGSEIKRGDKICEWDPFNAVIVSEFGGIAQFDSIIEGQTYRIERDDQTGYAEKVIVESKNIRMIPTIRIVSPDGEELKSYNLPVGSYISIEEGSEVKPGQKIVKIPR